MDFGIVDLIILVVIIASAILGAFKGFVSQLVSIAALLLGVWCAFKFTPHIANTVQNLFPIGETAVYIIAFVIILLVVMVLCNFAGKGIEKIMTLSMLGWLNRLLGIVFSAAKAIIIMSLIVFALNYADKAWEIIPDSWFKGSIFYPHLTGLSEKLFPYLQSLLK